MHGLCTQFSLVGYGGAWRRNLERNRCPAISTSDVIKTTRSSVLYRSIVQSSGTAPGDPARKPWQVERHKTTPRAKSSGTEPTQQSHPNGTPSMEQAEGASLRNNSQRQSKGLPSPPPLHPPPTPKPNERRRALNGRSISRPRARLMLRRSWTGTSLRSPLLIPYSLPYSPHNPRSLCPTSNLHTVAAYDNQLEPSNRRRQNMQMFASILCAILRCTNGVHKIEYALN